MSLILYVKDLPDHTVVFYRYILLAVASLLIICFRTSCQVIQCFKRIGKHGVFAGVLLGFSDLLFTYGVQHAGAFITLLLCSMGALFSSFFAYAFLNESVPFHTVIALSLCLASITSILAINLSISSSGVETAGLVSASCSSIAIGAYIVAVRHATVLAKRKSVQIYLYITINLILVNFA